MRSKSTLALIEQAIMLLVFAVAAVFCLRAFVWADGQSQQSVARDEAFLQAQCAAEVLKNSRGAFAVAEERWGGAWQEDTWVILYDEEWNRTEDMHTYTLRCTKTQSGLPYLGTAAVEVLEGETLLARLEVAWQEVTDRG